MGRPLAILSHVSLGFAVLFALIWPGEIGPAHAGARYYVAVTGGDLVLGSRDVPGVIRVPVGVLVLAACVLPLWRSRLLIASHRRRDRRIKGGLCGACGYDLRGGGDRCPECGASRPILAGQDTDPARIAEDLNRVR